MRAERRQPVGVSATTTPLGRQNATSFRTASGVAGWSMTWRCQPRRSAACVRARTFECQLS